MVLEGVVTNVTNFRRLRRHRRASGRPRASCVCPRSSSGPAPGGARRRCRAREGAGGRREAPAHRADDAAGRSGATTSRARANQPARPAAAVRQAQAQPPARAQKPAGGGRCGCVCPGAAQVAEECQPLHPFPHGEGPMMRAFSGTESWLPGRFEARRKPSSQSLPNQWFHRPDGSTGSGRTDLPRPLRERGGERGDAGTAPGPCPLPNPPREGGGACSSTSCRRSDLSALSGQVRKSLP